MADTTHLSFLERARVSPEDEAWRKLVEIYGPFSAGYLRRHGVRDADVDDICQDIMQILVRELPSFEHNGRKGAFRAWLRAVTANRLRAFWRSPARRQQARGGADYAQLADQLADRTSDLSRAWDREHNQHLIHRLLDLAATRFNDKTLQAFRLTFLDERPIDDVGKELGMSVNAVVVARSRVLKALREMGEGMID